MTLWCGSGFGSPDPYLWLMDPDSDPTPDPTTFFIDFKDAKKYFFLIFSYHLPTGTSPSDSKNFVLKFYFVGIISVRSTHFWDKGRTCGSCGSGYPTLEKILHIIYPPFIKKSGTSEFSRSFKPTCWTDNFLVVSPHKIYLSFLFFRESAGWVIVVLWNCAIKLRPVQFSLLRGILVSGSPPLLPQQIFKSKLFLFLLPMSTE